MIVEDVEVSGNVRYMICSYINTILYPQGTDPRRDCVVSLATATKRWSWKSHCCKYVSCRWVEHAVHGRVPNVSPTRRSSSRSEPRSSSRGGSRTGSALGMVEDGGHMKHSRREYLSPDEKTHVVTEKYEYDTGDTSKVSSRLEEAVGRALSARRTSSGVLFRFGHLSFVVYDMSPWREWKYPIFCYVNKYL